jgi:hypothetical protein
MILSDRRKNGFATEKTRQSSFQFAFNKWFVNLLQYASPHVAKRSNPSGFGGGVFSSH